MSRGQAARTSLAYIGATATQRGAPFLLLLFLATLVPVDQFGRFAVLAAIFGLLTSAATFGMETVAFRGFFTRDSPDLEARFYNTLVKLTVVAPVALAVALAAALALTTESLLGVGVGSVIATIFGGCLYAAGTTVPLARLRAQEKVTSYVVVVLVPVLPVVATKLVLCGFLDYGALGWAIGDLVCGVGGLLVALPHQVGNLLGRHMSAADLREAMRVGLPLLPHVLSGWTLNLSDRLLIAGILGSSAAGRYAFAAQVALIVTLLVTEINRALLPSYGRVLRDSRTAALRRVVEAQRILTLLIATLVAVGGTTAVAFAAPADYQSSARWIPVLCLSSAVYCLYMVPMNQLSIIAGRTTRMLAISSGTAGVNVLLNLTLLPQWGIGAAAYVTLGTYCLLLTLTSTYAGKYEGTAWTRRSTWGAAALVAVMVAAIAVTTAQS